MWPMNTCKQMLHKVTSGKLPSFTGIYFAHCTTSILARSIDVQYTGVLSGYANAEVQPHSGIYTSKLGATYPLKQTLQCNIQ